MTRRGALVLDNEAVQALLDPRHAKHRSVLAHLSAASVRSGKGELVEIIVPTSVRVEAGWVAAAHGAAVANHIPVRDHILDRAAAEKASAIRNATAVSVVDAHVGVAAAEAAGTYGTVAVLTSDPKDISKATANPSVIVISF